MSAEYSVGELRTEASKQLEYGSKTAWEMLTAYADRIEADERAVPVDRPRETPRRQQAVEMLLELGWTYNSERGWEEPATTAEPVTHPHSPDAADSGRVGDDVRKAIEQIKRLSTIYLKAGTAATDGLFKLAVAHGANETAAAVLAHDANGEMNELQSCVYGMAALAAQGQGEAVAWMCETVNGYTAFSRDGKFPCNAGKISPLYLHAEPKNVQGDAIYINATAEGRSILYVYPPVPDGVETLYLHAEHARVPDADTRDAARYRFLRDPACRDHAHHTRRCLTVGVCDWGRNLDPDDRYGGMWSKMEVTGEGMDEAVDAAILAAAPSQPEGAESGA